MLKKVLKIIKYVILITSGTNIYSKGMFYNQILDSYNRKLDEELLKEREKHKDNAEYINDINNKMIVNNLRLCIEVASGYKTNYHTFEEIQSAAVYGLIKAVCKFDPNKSSNFASYKITAIKNEILYMFRKDNVYYGKNLMVENMNRCYSRDKDTDIEYVDYIKGKINYFEDNVNKYIEQKNNEELVKVLYGIVEYNIKGNKKKQFYLNYMNDKKMTQAEIAKICNCSQTNVSKNRSDLNTKVYSIFENLESMSDEINVEKKEMWEKYKKKGEEVFKQYSRNVFDDENFDEIDFEIDM